MTSSSKSVAPAESAIPENSSITTVEDAVSETRSRVKWLTKFIKSNPKTYVTKDSRDAIWKIQKSFNDWKHWRKEVVAALVEEGYPEAAITLIKHTASKAVATKDEGLYKMSRNLFGSTANFSEFKDFRQLVARAGAVEVVMGFLSQEITRKKDPPSSKTKVKPAETDEQPNVGANDNFLVRSALQTMFHLLRSGLSTDEFMKNGAVNTFATMIDLPDFEVKCLAALCLLRLLGNKTPPAAKFIDDKNVYAIFLKAIASELAKGDVHRDFKLSIESLVDGLVFLCQNDANVKKLLQGGVVNTICSLLSSQAEPVQLRGVDLFLAMFFERLKMAQTSLSSEEFKTLRKLMLGISSSTLDSMPVLKARKLLANLKQMRNDPSDEVTPDDQEVIATPPEPQQPAPAEEQPLPDKNVPAVVESNKTEIIAADDKTSANSNSDNRLLDGVAGESTFKDNDLIHMLENAMAETRLRVNFLSKLHQLSPSSLVCSESAKAIDLLNDSFSAWQSAWRMKIIQVLLQERYQEVSFTFTTFLLKQDLERNEVSFQMLQNLLMHINNITDSSKESRLVFGNAGFIPLLLDFLEQSSSNKHPSAHTTDTQKNALLVVYNLSRINDTKDIFRESNATSILTKFLDSQGNSLIVSLCLAHLLSDTAESAKLADERGVIKTLVDLILTAMNQENRKAYVNGAGLFALEELMDGLCLLAVNDKNKQTLMDNGVVEMLTDLLASNLNQDQILGMDLLWTLCYEPTVRKQLRAQKDNLMVPLQNLTLSDDAEVQRSAKRTWEFIDKWDKMTAGDNRATASTQQNEIAKKRKAKPEDSHVFISYSWKQQPTVLQMKNALVSKGYKVWMDVEKMRGDLLESMSKAVENASVVLICFSHTYKLSNPCRAEAEYAYTLAKPIIPINMEYHYFPDGWLGMLVLTKKFIDLSLEKRPFDEAFDQLLLEVDAVLKKPAIDTATKIPSPTRKQSLLVTQQSQSAIPKEAIIAEPVANSSDNNSSVANQFIAAWSKSDVKKWLQRENLHQKFGPKMEEFDGERLSMLLRLENKAPEYYYQALSKHFNEPLPNMLQLFAAFSRLASPNNATNGT